MALDSAPAMVSIITQFFRLCSVEHNRKNWLFCDTPNGAQASAIVYTMVEMAKANGVNVYHYLTYLLEKLPNDRMSDEELDRLAPWNEEVKAEIERRANDLYEKYSVRDMNILKYPTMLSVEDYFSNTVSKDSITYNAGWCYGNAGIVRGLMKVSYYLNDNNNYQYYKKELLSIINQELDNYNFDLPIVCHGYASVLSIQISAFRESGDKSFLITRERNMRQTIISHRNCIFNDEYTNDYSKNRKKRNCVNREWKKRKSKSCVRWTGH